jgi:hypothetical protein
MFSHEKRADEIQRELIRKMSPSRRLAIASELYVAAWELKKGAMKLQHPDWSEAEVAARLRRIFLTGYAGD